MFYDSIPCVGKRPNVLLNIIRRIIISSSIKVYVLMEIVVMYYIHEYFYNIYLKGI